jgi:hypothetical protein
MNFTEAEMQARDGVAESVVIKARDLVMGCLLFVCGAVWLLVLA